MSQLRAYIWKEGVREKQFGDFRTEWRGIVLDAEKDAYNDEILKMLFCGLSMF